MARISWHLTICRHASVLYGLDEKYASFIFAVAAVMCSPDTEIEAMPSQPLFP